MLVGRLKARIGSGAVVVVQIGLAIYAFRLATGSGNEGFVVAFAIGLGIRTYSERLPAGLGQADPGFGAHEDVLGDVALSRALANRDLEGYLYARVG